MSLLLALSLVCGLMLPVSLSDLNPRYCAPRNTVPYQNDLKVFREEGISNYSTMLMREDLGVLLLGARDAIYALDMDDISVRKAAVYWPVSEEKQRECTAKGKNAEVECRNYIRALHQVNDTTTYVCGTNGFNPTCDYMTFVSGQLRLQGKQEKGKGKCPYDPFQRSSSLMVGNDLYSATSINFLGSEFAILRNSKLPLRTEHWHSWLNEPNFVSMEFVGESFDSSGGDDDKVYMFFSENAVEYDLPSKVRVSRVARVCKRDMGGHFLLQRKWTTFQKARLDCPLPETSLPPAVQDVFLLRHEDWRTSVFYAVFTQQSSLSKVSAVCAYSGAAISSNFNEGNFLTPVAMESNPVKWVKYNGDLPVPRPGACINNAARNMGMRSSLHLPDKTLHFIKQRPLMDEAVRPLTGGPLLVKSGALLTRIVVDVVQALDGQTHTVMFIGTENGFVQKAVNYDGEMFIIEETQLYEDQEPVSVLHLSPTKGLLYAGSDVASVQMPVSNCSRHHTCVDCLLARDPYCAWDFSAERCSSVRSSPPPSATTAAQSLKDGDASRCPRPDPAAAVDISLVPGNNIQLPCQPHSNLAEVVWHHSDQTLHPSHKHHTHSGGLLIWSAAEADAGLYTCDSVEQVHGRTYNRTVAVYRLKVHAEPGAGNSSDTLIADAGSLCSVPFALTGLYVAIPVPLLCLSLGAALYCICSRERRRRWTCFRFAPVIQISPEHMRVQNRKSKKRFLGPASGRPRAANNNHTIVDFKGDGEGPWPEETKHNE